MAWSTAGLVGALAGLVLGVIDYRLVAGFVERSLRRTLTATTPAERDDFERRIRIMRIALAVGTIGAFPIFGYMLGRYVFG